MTDIRTIEVDDLLAPAGADHRVPPPSVITAVSIVLVLMFSLTGLCLLDFGDETAVEPVAHLSVPPPAHLFRQMK